MSSLFFKNRSLVIHPFQNFPTHFQHPPSIHNNFHQPFFCFWRCEFPSQSFKCQPHQMVKYAQTIRWLLPTNCLSVFDHFMGLVLKGLRKIMRLGLWSLQSTWLAVGYTYGLNNIPCLKMEKNGSDWLFTGKTWSLNCEQTRKKAISVSKLKKNKWKNLCKPFAWVTEGYAGETVK